MQAVVDTLGSDVPGLLTGLITLGRTLKKRAADILAYVDPPEGRTAPRMP